MNKNKTAVARRVAFLLALAGAYAPAHAQDFDRIAPKAVTPPGKPDPQGPVPAPLDTTIRLAELKGIVFLASPGDVRKEGVTGVSGLDVSRVPDLQTDAFRNRMARFIGRPVSLASIDTLVQDVIAFYNEQDRPFVIAAAPEQDISGGVLQVVVIEGRVGQVRILGAKAFSERLYRDAIGLKPGDRIVKRRLDDDIEWLNRNPFRSTSVHLVPGAETGTTDVNVRTAERSPFRLYAGYDDTGTTFTDDKRLSFGLNWGNVFGLDHQLNYQYSVSPDFDTFRAHSLSYVVPLPWRHLLTLFGATSDVEGRVAAPFGSGGRSQQLGLRYEVPLPRYPAYSHSLIGGLDWKRTNNNLEFGGTTVNTSSADIAQALVSYTGRLLDANGTTSFTANLFHSPGGVTSRNDDADFQTLRAFAEARYTYFNLQATRITRLPAEFSWHATAEIQLSDGNLLGSEQLGAGGYYSVRGYDEREANGDEGFLLRNELRTPAYRLGAWMPGKQAELQFLGFVDYGTVSNVQLLPGEPRHINLASAGFGARFSLEQNVTARLDYGWQLKDSGLPGSPRNGRAHFSVVVSY